MRDISARKLAAAQFQELNANLEQQVATRTQLLDTARRDLQSILDITEQVASQALLAAALRDQDALLGAIHGVRFQEAASALAPMCN